MIALKFILSIESIFANACGAIDITVSGILISFAVFILSKASAPIISTPFGISITVSDVPLNADDLISLTEEGITTEVRFVFWFINRSGITVTFEPILTDEILLHP